MRTAAPRRRAAAAKLIIVHGGCERNRAETGYSSWCTAISSSIAGAWKLTQ